MREDSKSASARVRVLFFIEEPDARAFALVAARRWSSRARPPALTLSSSFFFACLMRRHMTMPIRWRCHTSSRPPLSPLHAAAFSSPICRHLPPLLHFTSITSPPPLLFNTSLLLTRYLCSFAAFCCHIMNCLRQQRYAGVIFKRLLLHRGPPYWCDWGKTCHISHAMICRDAASEDITPFTMIFHVHTILRFCRKSHFSSSMPTFIILRRGAAHGSHENGFAPAYTCSSACRSGRRGARQEKKREMFVFYKKIYNMIFYKKEVFCLYYLFYDDMF